MSEYVEIYDGSKISMTQMIEKPNKMSEYVEIYDGPKISMTQMIENICEKKWNIKNEKLINKETIQLILKYVGNDFKFSYFRTGEMVIIPNTIFRSSCYIFSFLCFEIALGIIFISFD